MPLCPKCFAYKEEHQRGGNYKVINTNPIQAYCLTRIDAAYSCWRWWSRSKRANMYTCAVPIYTCIQELLTIIYLHFVTLQKVRLHLVYLKWMRHICFFLIAVSQGPCFCICFRLMASGSCFQAGKDKGEKQEGVRAAQWCPERSHQHTCRLSTEMALVRRKDWFFFN